MAGSGPVHISSVLVEAMGDISARIERRRRLDALLPQIDEARDRIAELYRELGPEVERETRGVPQSQVGVS